MTRTKTVYKVVAVRNGRLVSLITDAPLEVVYKPGEPVEGKFGPLFAFSKLEDAVSMASGANGILKQTQIWKARATNVRKARVALWIGHSMTPYTVQQFWDRYFRGYDSTYALPTPRGSVICDTITLLERVQST